jgi:dethiobiotin synthetase
MKPLIVTGTDTGIGKTVAAAMLTLAQGGIYWKPIQCGTEDGTDKDTVAELTGLDATHFRPEGYILREPLSPHRAAELENRTIDPVALDLPDDIPAGRRLIVEGAGGLMVPVTRELLQIDLFARWQAPVVLCARTQLGTINHSLLSLAALRARNIPVLGVLFIGEAMADSERTICDFGAVKHLGRLPFLAEVNAAALRDAFAQNFNRRDFDA